MSDDLSTDRDALLKLLSLVRPALSTLDYIPALKHIRFSGMKATAYNDISAISVGLPSDALDLGLCLPGEMLIRSLGSFNAKSVMLQPNEKDGSLLVTSGRSKIKLPSMKQHDFPLEVPATAKGTPMIELNADIMKAVQLCLISVGNDPTHPATMGVTLDAADGKAILFSTDNATISRASTKTKIKLPGDAPVILPTFFCEQLVALSKAFPKAEIELELPPGALVAYFWIGDVEVAMLFSKSLVDVQPLDFPKIISKHCKIDGIAEKLRPIPDAFDAAFGRALLILGAEQDKATKMTVGTESIRIFSTSSVGECNDSMSFPSDAELDPFHVDPSLVARACKACTHVGFFNRVVVMGDEKGAFLHLLSHCAAS